MKTIDSPPAIDLDAEWAATIDRIEKGIRNPKTMDHAVHEMDEGRGEIRQRIGETNIAAGLTDRDE